MVVHRKRPHRPPQHTSRVTTLGMLSSGDLGEAANIIAEEARRIASTWSQQIPPSIGVEVTGRVATVYADAPPARPAELRLRHPLFGDRHFWYGPPGDKFLAPAADAKADAAMQRYAQVIDQLARRAGFR